MVDEETQTTGMRRGDEDIVIVILRFRIEGRPKLTGGQVVREIWPCAGQTRSWQRRNGLEGHSIRRPDLVNGEIRA